MIYPRIHTIDGGENGIILFRKSLAFFLIHFIEYSFFFLKKKKCILLSSGTSQSYVYHRIYIKIIIARDTYAISPVDVFGQ